MCENKDMIKQKSQEYLQYMIDLRRAFHRYPELGFDEKQTSQTVKQELQKMNIEFKSMADTGVVGLIHGSKPGKTLLIRADMDALEIEEQTGAAFSSQRPGLMHACGHDGHTACLLGVAKILSGMKDQFCGTVKLMFQPSEEYVSGAQRMIEEGILENPKVDYAIAHHLWGDVKKGHIAVRHGGIMAAPDKFTFKIKAVGGHGSTPDLCTDVIALASQAINMIYSTLNRKLGAFDEAAVSICSLHAGKEYNILPGEITAIGTIRSFDPEIRKRIPDIMKNILQGVTGAVGAEYEFILEDENGPVRNDNALTDIVARSAKKIVGEDYVEEIKKGALGGEDFAYITELIPSSYFFVGISDDLEHPIVHHSSDFRWDDSLLEISAAVTCQAALDILHV